MRSLHLVKIIIAIELTNSTAHHNAMSLETASLPNSSIAPAIEYLEEPLASNVFRLIVYTIIFLVTVTGNLSVLAVVYKTRELHTGK